VSAFVFAVAAVGWRRHRTEPALRNPAALAAVLLVVQVLLGAATVKLVLPPWLVIIHLANAMLLLATLMVVGLRASAPEGPAMPPLRTRHEAHGLVLGTVLLGFVVILFGAQVANFHAGLVCLGFPLCAGGILPPASSLGALHWTQRVRAFAFVGLAALMASRVSRRSDAAGR
jgi:heme A synthase